MASSTSYRAVLFDLDDTLVDRKSAYDFAYRRFYDSQPAVRRVSTWDEAREFFWTLSPANATNARTAIGEIMRRWPGVASDPEAHRKFYFETLIEGLDLLPGVGKFVDALGSSGLPWGVVTNGDQYQYRKVERVGLEATIPFVLASELFGIAKPAPEIYNEAVRMLGLTGADHARILFVGDNPYTDVTGAHGVGMKTAWVRMGREYPADAPEPDITVDSVVELAPALGL